MYIAHGETVLIVDVGSLHIAHGETVLIVDAGSPNAELHSFALDIFDFCRIYLN